MAMKSYVGYSGKARRIKNAYVGIASKARKLKNIYVGINNKARTAFVGKIGATQEGNTTSPLASVFTKGSTPVLKGSGQCGNRLYGLIYVRGTNSTSSSAKDYFCEDVLNWSIPNLVAGTPVNVVSRYYQSTYTQGCSVGRLIYDSYFSDGFGGVGDYDANDRFSIGYKASFGAWNTSGTKASTISVGNTVGMALACNNSYGIYMGGGTLSKYGSSSRGYDTYVRTSDKSLAYNSSLTVATGPTCSLNLRGCKSGMKFNSYAIFAGGYTESSSSYTNLPGCSAVNGSLTVTNITHSTYSGSGSKATATGTHANDTYALILFSKSGSLEYKFYNSSLTASSAKTYTTSITFYPMYSTYSYVHRNSNVYKLSSSLVESLVGAYNSTMTLIKGYKFTSYPNNIFYVSDATAYKYSI